MTLRGAFCGLVAGGVVACSVVNAPEDPVDPEGTGGSAGCDLILCGEVCVDTSSDASHCGECGNACSGSESCVDGQCTSGGCPTGQEECNGNCVDTMTDPTNCGVCGVICPAGVVSAQPACENGQCTFECLSPYGDCNDDISDGCETDTSSDITNCGDCGVVCDETNATATCNGSCQLTCDMGFDDCDGDPATGCEVEIDTDPMNCGTCGMPCGMGQSCAGGMCSTCGDSTVSPGEEVDPPNSPFSNVSIDSTTCRWDFSQVPQLYCNGGCSWAGGSGCDQADADIFCKLKTDNPNSTATTFQTATALSTYGFSCPNYGTNLGPLPSRGVTVNVWFQEPNIQQTHGSGQVITSVVCTDP